MPKETHDLPVTINPIPDPEPAPEPEPAPDGERKRRAHPEPDQLSTSRIKRVFAQGPVKDWADFRARYTAMSRGITSERIAAVRVFQKTGDMTKLKKVLGTKSDSTAFKAIGQVQDYLTPHEKGTGGPLQRYAREVGTEFHRAPKEMTAEEA